MLLDNEANHLFSFVLQTGLARCADRLPFLKELEECSQYLQPWLFWSSSPSTSGVPKITAMLCQTKHPLSGLKQSTSKELAFHDTFDRHSCQIIGMCSQSRWHSLLFHRVALDSFRQSFYINTLHPSAVCRPWVNWLHSLGVKVQHHVRLECLFGLESWHQLGNVDLDLAWAYSVVFDGLLPVVLT